MFRVMRFVEVAPGVRLSVLDGRGSGPLVLLVHGLASNARLWAGVGSELSRHGQGWCAVDLRSHGESSKVDDGFDFATIVSDLVAVIGERGPVLAVGQSWGGNIVVELAVRHPELVAGVICVDGGFIRLMDAFADWETVSTVLRPPDFTGRTLRQLEDGMGSHFSGWPQSSIDGQLANFEDAGDGTVRPRLTLDRHLRILRWLWEHDPDLAASGIVAPVSVIAVRDGWPGKRERVESFASKLRQGSVRWVDADHDVHAQHPELVADLIRSMR